MINVVWSQNLSPGYVHCFCLIILFLFLYKWPKLLLFGQSRTTRKSKCQYYILSGTATNLKEWVDSYIAKSLHCIVRWHPVTSSPHGHRYQAGTSQKSILRYADSAHPDWRKYHVNRAFLCVKTFINTKKEPWCQRPTERFALVSVLVTSYQSQLRGGIQKIFSPCFWLWQLSWSTLTKNFWWHIWCLGQGRNTTSPPF